MKKLTGNTRARRTSRRLVSIVATGVLVAALLAVAGSTAGATTPSCWARDGLTPASSNLQSVIDGASSGDTIVIKGVCFGNYAIAKNLTLKGLPKATLDGGGNGSVVTMTNEAAVTFTSLLITHGHAIGDAGNGGGIYTDDGGTITLNSSFVNGNVADNYGGGIEINSGTTLTLNGFSQVNGNSAAISGGIDTYTSTIFLTDFSQMNGNHASVQSGGTDNYGGTMTVKGFAQVAGNTSDGPAGGIFNYFGGTLTLSGFAQVDHNTAAGTGGGIRNGNIDEPGGGTLTLQGHARVNGNKASDGGGIYNDLADGGILNGAFAGVNVRFNVPNNIVSI